MDPQPHHPLARFLALNRTVAVVLLSVLLFGLAEQLWEPFMPAYLHAQGKEAARSAEGILLPWAVLWAIGLYGFFRHLFEAFCFIGGGQLTHRLGDRGSLILFGALTLGGYVLFLAAALLPQGAAVPAEARMGLVIFAALLIIAWEPLSVPVTFTTVGATVDQSRQGMAFAVQSIQKRLPRILGPLIAGQILTLAGAMSGMTWLIVAALWLASISLAVQFRYMPHREPPPPGPPTWHILRELHPRLRRLLVAEIFTRWCDWLVRDFVVLYVLLAYGVSPAIAGALMAVQHVTALLTYLPVGKMTERAGLQPFIGLTFVFFALFPLALVLAQSEPWLFVAFIVYGLREVGEPARKALITSLMPEAVRARGVGLYWGLRALAISTAPLAGAAVWGLFGPRVLLYSAFALGCVGAAVFYLFCRETADVRTTTP